ncbi:hypothetical protein oki164_08870 [Helicobacter pylori]
MKSLTRLRFFYCQKTMKANTTPKYCELEHLLEKMAKESENKAFYTSFRQHYDTLLDEASEEIHQNQTLIRREQKNAPNAGYNPISRFLFV